MNFIVINLRFCKLKEINGLDKRINIFPSIKKHTFCVGLVLLYVLTL